MTRSNVEIVHDKYWLVSDQFGGHAVIQASGYAIDAKGNLEFHLGTEGDVLWETANHTTNGHFWRSVTQCDSDGTPLWQRDVHQDNINVKKPDINISSADVEALAEYIDTVALRAIRNATKD